MRKTVLKILIIAILVFIFGQSVLPKMYSASESGWLAFLLGIDNDLLRKIAHFSEYAVFGFLSAMYMACSTEKLFSHKNLGHLLCIGFFVGFIDETIHIFSGRGPMISDVWIDFAGFAAGSVITLLIIYSVRKNKRN